MKEQKSFVTLKDEANIDSQTLQYFMNQFSMKSSIVVASKSWQNKNVGHVCEGIDEWKLSQIQAYGNDEPLILKHIENINFSSLIFLNIWGNKIFSIEGICRVKMPLLKKLWIWRNDITRFDSLRKAFIPMLEHLDIKQNPMVNLSCLTELKTVQKLERLHADQSLQICYEVIKLEAQFIADIRFEAHSSNSKGKIRHAAFSSQLLKKCQNKK